MEQLWIIAAVMFGSGVLGGTVNCFLSDRSGEIHLSCYKHIIIGVAASFMVPLFLNMISGDLIDKICGVDGKTANYSKLFVLAGFCLVASISSRTFILSLSERILQEVKSANRKANEAKEEAAEAKAAVAPLVEDEVADDMSALAESNEIISSAEVAENEKAVLKSIVESPYTLRSISGIAKNSGLRKSVVNSTLSSLIGKGLVAQSIGSSGRPLWYITPTGRAEIRSG
jgi:DNA-binding MarR family transcriptional regulator